MMTNPILPGFYPDPSIVRVDEDYYIVTSSFSFYPGIPLFISKNLTEWTQVGYVLDRPEQLHVTYEMMSAGIFAPTIRYYNGVYYVLATNMTLGCRNFLVKAQDPRGPWSEPYFIEGADGIDPSLFFDDDGKCYYTGTTRFNDENGDHQAIWCSEFDIENNALIGERKIVWAGAMVDAYAPEGPHIYKKDDRYYLMIAEGGTELHHAVTISRSDSVMGPYVGCPNNPIMTHRHLGKHYPISNVGHGDLVETPSGEWYMVLLGSRLSDNKARILGRETFIVPVVWEDGWPVIAPGKGVVELGEQINRDIFRDDFDTNTLELSWNMLGTPYNRFWKLDDSMLMLRYNQVDIVPRQFNGISANPFDRIKASGKSKDLLSFIGRRIQDLEWEARTEVILDMEKEQEGGLVILQNDGNQIRVAIQWMETVGTYRLTCFTTRTVRSDDKIFYEDVVHGTVDIVKRHNNCSYGCITQTVMVRVICRQTKFGVYVSESTDRADGEQTSEKQVTGGRRYEELCLSDPVDGSFLGSESSGGFIGSYLGFYGMDLKGEIPGYFKVNYFEYRPM